jgi:hypothetical protein
MSVIVVPVGSVGVRGVLRPVSPGRGASRLVRVRVVRALRVVGVLVLHRIAGIHDGVSWVGLRRHTL